MHRQQALRIAAAAALILVVAALVLGTHPAEQPEKAELAAYLKDHWMAPEDYIVSKFKDHDLVFVGEQHRVKHDPLLIQAVIPKLYKAGIYNLGMEFANSSDQSKIDQLITDRHYDQNMARQILFNMWSSWGYQEYMDLLRVAWRLNRSLPKSAPRFRIVGLNYAANYKLLTGPIDQLTNDQRKAVFFAGENDAFMARVILKEFVDKNQKALIYCGIHHAFTHYQMPVYDYENKKLIRLVNSRTANFIYRKIGTRAFLIFLHGPWQSKESPIKWAPPEGGEIDAVMASFTNQRIGFDVVGTPFGQLRDSNTFYAFGHDDFKLEDFCDGYVYQMPLKDYQGVTTDPHFVTKKNFTDAVQGIANFESRKNYKRPEDFIRMMRNEADVQVRFRAWNVFPAP